MSDKQITEFLAKVPLFKSLKRRHLEGLAKVCVEREFGVDQDIVKQGEGGVGLFTVVSGQANALLPPPDGEHSIVTTFGPTDYFGELALLTEGTRTASVTAVEPTVCLVLTRWQFLGALHGDAEMAVSILEELAWRFRAALEVI